MDHTETRSAETTRPNSSLFPIPDPSTLQLTQIPSNPLSEASISTLFNAMAASDTLGDVVDLIRETEGVGGYGQSAFISNHNPNRPPPPQLSQNAYSSQSNNQNNERGQFSNFVLQAFQSPHPVAQSLKAPLFKRYGGLVDFFFVYKMGTDPLWSHTLKHQGKNWSFSQAYGSRNQNELNFTTNTDDLTFTTNITNQASNAPQSQSTAAEYKFQSRTSVKYKKKKQGEGTVELVSQGATSKITTSMKLNVTSDLVYALSSSFPLPYSYDIAKDEYWAPRGKQPKVTGSTQRPSRSRPPSQFTPSLTSSFTYRPEKPIGMTNCSAHFEATQKDYQVLSASYSHSFPFNYISPPKQSQKPSSQSNPIDEVQQQQQPPPVGEISIGARADVHLVPTFNFNQFKRFTALQVGLNYEIPQLLASYVLFEPMLSQFNTASSSGSFPTSSDDPQSDPATDTVPANNNWYHQFVFGLHHQRSKILSLGTKVVITPKKGPTFTAMAEYKPLPELTLKLKLVSSSAKPASSSLDSPPPSPTTDSDQPPPVSASPSSPSSPFSLASSLGGITVQAQYQFPRPLGYNITAHGHYNPNAGTTNFGMQATLALDKTNFATNLFKTTSPTLTPLFSAPNGINMKAVGQNGDVIGEGTVGVEEVNQVLAIQQHPASKPTGKSVSLYSKAVHSGSVDKKSASSSTRTSEKPTHPVLPNEDTIQKCIDPQTGFFKKGFKFYNYDTGSQARVSDRGD